MLQKLIDRLPLGWQLRLALLRLLARWQSLLTVFAGVLLACSVAAGIRLYTDTVAQAGLNERLQAQQLSTIHGQLSTSFTDTTDLNTNWNHLDARLRTAIERDLTPIASGWVASVVAGAETLSLTVESDTATDGELRLATYEQLESRVELIAGNLPQAGADPVQVAISSVLAEQASLQVGDRVQLSDRRESSTPVSVEISAIVTERNPFAAYWLSPSPLRSDVTATGRYEGTALVARADFLQIMQNSLPEMRARLNWRLLFDYTRLPFAAVDTADAALNTFDASLDEVFTLPDGDSQRVVYDNDVQPVLREYREDVQQLSAPFALLLLQVVGLVLIFVQMIVELVRRSETQEVSLLRLRGARSRQIVLLRAIELLLLCLLAAVIAPLLVQRLLIMMMPGLLGVERISLQVDALALMLSAVAALVAWGLLVGSLVRSLRHSTKSDETVPWWRRYYIDVLLMVVLVAELARLLNSSQQNQGADPLLLLAPTLLAIAAGSVLLRLFSPLMYWLAHLAGRSRGLSRALSVWQISRESAYYGRIVFLLSLAVATGWFAISFRATLQQSQSDRARYHVGADARLPQTDISVRVPGQYDVHPYRNLDTVQKAALALRFDDQAITVNRPSIGGGEVLFISSSLPDVTTLRDDLAPLPRLPADSIVQPDEFGQPLTTIPTRIRVRGELAISLYIPGSGNEFITEINGAFHLPEMTVSAVFQTEHAENQIIPLSNLSVDGLGSDPPPLTASDLLDESPLLVAYQNALVASDGQFTLSADIPPGTFEAPPRFIALRVDVPSVSGLFSFQGLLINSLQITGSDTSVERLEDVAQPNIWQVDGIRNTYYEEAFERDRFQAYMPVRSSENTEITMRYNYPEQKPVPVLASDSFLETNNLIVGNTFELFVGGNDHTFYIDDSVRYYPTLYNDERPFFVGDLDTYLYSHFLQASDTSGFDAEIWLGLADDTDINTVLNTLRQQSSEVADNALFYERVRETSGADTLTSGLAGLLYLAFLVALLLSIISLLTFAAHNARLRQPEFGYLMAVGVPPRRLLIGLMLEQLLILGIALSLGSVLGAFLSQNVLPVLANSTTSEPVVPPFIVQIEVVQIMQFLGLLTLTMLLVVALSAWLMQRLSLSRTLRLGEE